MNHNLDVLVHLSNFSIVEIDEYYTTTLLVVVALLIIKEKILAAATTWNINEQRIQVNDTSPIVSTYLALTATCDFKSHLRHNYYPHTELSRLSTNNIYQQFQLN